MHLTGNDASVPAAVDAGVGRFVVSTNAHLAMLSACGGHRVRVVIDRSAELAALMPVIVTSRRLEIVGLHHRIGDDSSDPLGVQAVRDAIGDMAWLRRAYGVLVTHVCLDGLDLGSWWDVPRMLGQAAEALDETVEASCEHHRYPRPVLSLTPSESSLTRTPAAPGGA